MTRYFLWLILLLITIQGFDCIQRFPEFVFKETAVSNSSFKESSLAAAESANVSRAKFNALNGRHLAVVAIVIDVIVIFLTILLIKETYSKH